MVSLVLYTWSIPHAGDDACLPGDAEELLSQVMPVMAMRGMVTVEDAQRFIDTALELKLLERYEDCLRFPPRAFYGYQAYITDSRKPTVPSITQNHADPRTSAQNREEPRDSAQNHASFKSSLKSSFNRSAYAPLSARPPAREDITNEDVREARRCYRCQRLETEPPAEDCKNATWHTVAEVHGT